MTLHIGNDVAVNLESVLLILNGQHLSADSRAYLETARREHRLVRSGGGTPKCFVATMERGRVLVHESPVAAQTLIKRIRQEQAYSFLETAAALSILPANDDGDDGR